MGTQIFEGFLRFANVYQYLFLLILSHPFKKLLQDDKARYLKIGQIDEEVRLFYEEKSAVTAYKDK
ncbi:hypothetical protein BRE01_08570 [Brevibacillus reuszeri]|uniref:Uncharacterized protein n=1 Tax=Brevibacillus reuszeri TaxID=54915 RepID=A0A0K9YRZ7_9BACL|nr:hypothetical protein [Brevibacillus reuszeri]KNB71504.1 hypothetical protein ADS79_22280 [Brevibacillus reuszeri]MED1855695.1 hypothetical protein [Brevibacillus reuszeri]GED67155.1 hypothetical protein BRE01_08570 [Brevibacillus reuszeri]